MRDIGDDERRLDRSQEPPALRVAAGWLLRRCRGDSTMAPHRVRRRSWPRCHRARHKRLGISGREY